MLNQKKLKVALLFSGQVRNIPPQIFNQGLRKFTQSLDVDVYLSYWDEPGMSMGHNLSKLNHLSDVDFSVEDYLRDAFKGFNIRKTESESNLSWRKCLNFEYDEILKSDAYSRLTIHSLSQIYQIYKSFSLVEEFLDEYDIVMRCRYDLLFVVPFEEFNFKKNTVYGLNFGRAYHPNRIYDIFFWGSPGALQSTFKTWKKIPQFIQASFDNGLDKRDACRLLYLGATFDQVSVVSGEVRYCDVYRPEKTVYDYLMKMLYWKLVDKSASKILKSSVYIHFFRYSTQEIGILKTRCLRVFSFLGLHKWGTLSYWKKKVFNILNF